MRDYPLKLPSMATAQEPARLAAHPAQLALALEQQRRAFAVDAHPSASERRERLARLARMLRKNAAAIRDAITADFGVRSAEETELLEQFTSLDGIAYARRNLGGWMRAERRAVAWWSLPGGARLLRQPLGVVGIIVPWNYPLYLAVSPLTGALAAGNRAMLKMSEHTPRFGALFESLVARTFRADEVAVVNGDVSVARAFSALPFDHLLFTGSTAVGREVMKAASANLTPVTLELGGKSPAIVTDSFDVEESARRIMYGKLINGGQTCVAPDYALVPERAGEPVHPRVPRSDARVLPGARHQSAVHLHRERPPFPPPRRRMWRTRATSAPPYTTCTTSRPTRSGGVWLPSR